MIWRSALLMAVLLLGFDRAEAGDIYPSQISHDGKVKVTLLYVGTNHDKQFWQPFVVTFLLEDRRTKEEIQRSPNAIGIDSLPYVYPSGSTLAFGTPYSGVERGGGYEHALQPSFRALYSLVNIPKPTDPKNTGVYEFFYKWIPQSPLQIVFHPNSRKTPEITFDRIKPTDSQAP